MINKAIAYSWMFGSKSNPNATPHETLQYTDGTISCNCSGWTRRVAEDGSRTCTHVRMVESGLADSACLKKLDLTTGKIKPKPIKVAAPIKEEVVEQKKAPNIVRKISW